MSLQHVSGFVYLLTFIISLLFYTSRAGSQAIYFGAGALIIDLMAITAGLYTIYFAFLSYTAGMDLALVSGIILIGSVVSAMHLAKWIVRFPMQKRSRSSGPRSKLTSSKLTRSIAGSIEPVDTHLKQYHEVNFARNLL